MAVMSDLPSELLYLIAENLNEAADLIRFRSVSLSWRDATSSIRMPLLSVPWLFLFHSPDNRCCYLYSFSEDRIYAIHIPDIWASVDFSSPSNKTGWFPASMEKNADGNYNSLLNLFTGKAVDLPDPHFDLTLRKAFIFLENMQQILAHGKCFCNLYDMSLAAHYDLSLRKSLTKHDICLYFLSLERCAPMVTSDIKILQTLSPSSLPVRDEQCYLAVSSYNFYVLVNYTCSSPVKFKVFVMHRQAPKREWAEVRDIGNKAILHGKKCCFLVEASGSAGLIRNSVYLPELKPCETEVDGNMDWVYRMTRFDLSSGSCEEVNCQLNGLIISDSWKQESSADTHSWIVPDFD